MTPQPTEATKEPLVELSLKQDLMKGILSHGFENLSEIQKRLISTTLNGRDCILQAPSGIGKTASFTISMLQVLDFQSPGVQAIVVSPALELAVQTNGIINSIGKFLRAKSILAVGGFSSVRDDCQTIRRENPHILCGTLGRLADILERDLFDPRSVKVLILDEADQLLLPTFVDQLKSLIQKLTHQTQIILVSATLPTNALDLSRRFLQNPIHLLMKPEELPRDGIRQYHVRVDHEGQKFDTLCDLYSEISKNMVMVFCHSTETVQKISAHMNRLRLPCKALHGEMSRDERRDTMTEFRNGGFRVLICTEAIARGIDIQQLYCVVNYDMPKGPVIYLHRIGRCGRYGRKGLAITFCLEHESRTLDSIERHFQRAIPELQIADLQS